MMTGGRGETKVVGPAVREGDRVLTPAALAFVADLVRKFRPTRDALLATRRMRQLRFDAGERPHFLSETAAVRLDEWTIAPVPPDLRDRRVEITGPVDRKMVINALNSGASVFMADFEDANAPTWANCVQGQANLRDAVAGTIEYAQPDSAKMYRLNSTTATLMVRPRGWHLPERHVLVDNEPSPASLVDFGLFLFHNAWPLIQKGSGPYFYLPKLESHLEARLWNDVFKYAQDGIGIPRGTIRATVLIETLPAAFEMDEILWELREHSAGLNCGRWDYIFSYIKTLRSDSAAVLPDRSQITMDKGFLRAYVQLLIRTCHRRSAHAMGGMAAQIPIKDDPDANQAALEKVRADKLREVTDGHDGTWVAHPGLVPIAREVFDAHMPSANQIDRTREDVQVSEVDLLRAASGTRTEAGLRHNVRVAIQYIERWLGGSGCVPLYHLMEDTATAEICRAQIWQWIAHHAPLDDGRVVTTELFRTILQQETDLLGRDPSGGLEEAVSLLEDLVTSTTFEDFLTLPAYERLVATEPH